MFVVMPVALQATGVPGLIAFLFFALLAIAAITSMIALFETVIAVTEEWGWHRERTIWAVAAGTGFVGLSTVLSFNLWKDVHPLAFLPGFATRTPFDIADWFASNIGLTTAALISALFAGWVLSRANAADELGVAPDSLGFHLWRFLVRLPVPAAVAALLLAALFGWGETTG
jgi:NSS family neurotransmitter:Na+ symporter